MINYLSYIWQLPQNICGIIWKYIKRNSIITTISNNDIRKVGASTYLMKAGGAVTLGKYVFISQTYQDQTNTIKHECGHVKQSIILGPLYLIVVGIPSILHACLNNYLGCCWKEGKYNYYHFYTEHILMGEFDIRNK